MQGSNWGLVSSENVGDDDDPAESEWMEDCVGGKKILLLDPDFLKHSTPVSLIKSVPHHYE